MGQNARALRHGTAEILAGEKLAYSEPFIDDAMTQPINIDALRAQVRAMDYVRGTAAEIEQWREANAEACANLAIEGMDLTIEDHAMFAMFMEEGVPPSLVPQIVLSLYGKGSTSTAPGPASVRS